MIHSKSKICPESAYIYPRPDLIEHRFFGEHRTAIRDKCNVERDNARHRDRTARDNTAEKFITKLAADQPIDHGTRKRCKNY